MLDSGVDYTHPDLRENMWVNWGEVPNNGRDDDGNGYVDDVFGYDFALRSGDPMDGDPEGHGARHPATHTKAGDTVRPTPLVPKSTPRRETVCVRNSWC